MIFHKKIFQCVTAPIPLFQTPQKIGLLRSAVMRVTRPNIFTDFNACLFADDTTFLVSDHDTQSLFNTCEIGLGKFADWCSANRLSLNVSKTNYMLFSNLSLG